MPQDEQIAHRIDISEDIYLTIRQLVSTSPSFSNTFEATHAPRT